MAFIPITIIGLVISAFWYSVLNKNDKDLAKLNGDTYRFSFTQFAVIFVVVMIVLAFCAITSSGPRVTDGFIRGR